MENEIIQAVERSIARLPLSKKLRFEVFKRDGFKCQYCGGHPPGKILEVDHIDPVVNGGSNDETNLITACFDCNRGKGARSLSDVPRALADRASEVAEREEQIAGYEAIMRAVRARIEIDSDEILGKFCIHFKKKGIPEKHFQSIKRFITGLGLHETIQCCDMAITRKPYYYDVCFSYFCGICWNKIRAKMPGGQ
jgi:HNH endonuclease